MYKDKLIILLGIHCRGDGKSPFVLGKGPKTIHTQLGHIKSY
jgi:hypothetical protein